MAVVRMALKLHANRDADDMQDAPVAEPPRRSVLCYLEVTGRFLAPSFRILLE